MRYVKLIALFSFVFAGCGMANSRYVRRNYEVGKTIEAAIGNPVVEREDGVKNNVYGNVLSSFQRQLIYGGMTGNTIRLTYREFSNNIARPAFSQELQYDLSASDVIAYQKLRLKVLSATNERIVVEVLESADPGATTSGNAGKAQASPPPVTPTPGTTAL